MIKFKGKYKDELQLKEGYELPNQATEFKEGKNITTAFIRGTLIILPLIAVMIIIGLLKIDKVNSNSEENLSFAVAFIIMLLIAQVFTYLHEIIHAILYPKNAIIEIWKDSNQGAYFVYCNSKVSKIRFIIICLAPVLILGIIPYIIWLFVAHLLPLNISICGFILTLIMILMSVGDFYNIYNAIIQVPNDAKVFNYGIHSYWIK